MYQSDDLTAFHLHEALLQRSDRELEIRRRVAERAVEDAEAELIERGRDASADRGTYRRRFHRSRFALR